MLSRMVYADIHFNSYEFIVIFLPLILTWFYLWFLPSVFDLFISIFRSMYFRIWLSYWWTPLISRLIPIDLMMSATGCGVSFFPLTLLTNCTAFSRSVWVSSLRESLTLIAWATRYICWWNLSAESFWTVPDNCAFIFCFASSLQASIREFIWSN